MSSYRTEIVWPPFKGKAYKVVDGAGRGVGLYRTAEGARRKVAALNREAESMPRVTVREANAEVRAMVADSAEEAPTDHFRQCVRCGQTVITRADVPRCETCQRLERQPQGEATRLFTPAPNQIPGQLAL
jgi:hypothetical protein